MRNVVLWNLENINYSLIARIDDDNEVHEFVCAYKYNEVDETWVVGSSFKTLLTALCYINSLSYSEDLRERRVYIAKNIPSDLFDAVELVSVVEEVFDVLRDVSEIGEGHVTDALKQLGYCD